VRVAPGRTWAPPDVKSGAPSRDLAEITLFVLLL
jgi:hypothetical protein